MKHERPKQHSEVIEFTPDQMVEIDGSIADPALPSIMGQRAVAELSLGGTSEQAPAKIIILSINDKYHSEYLEVVHRGPQRAIDSDFALVAIDDRDGRPYVSGVSFLPKADPRVDMVRFGIVGKRSDDPNFAKVKWIDFGVEQQRELDWTPFDANETVSQSHIAIMNESDKISVFAFPAKPGDSSQENPRSAIRGAGVKIVNNKNRSSDSKHKYKKRDNIASRLGRLLGRS